MTDLSLLSRDANYHIMGEIGTWKFHRRDTSGRNYKYIFRRLPQDKIRAKTLTLTEVKAKKHVWEEVNTVNLSRLESFRGE